MTATLRNKFSFYAGDVLGYSLANAVAKAGGTEAHLNLFKFILTNSITATNRVTNSKLYLHDSRAACSTLFVFPPNVQLLLATLLATYEKELSTSFSENKSFGSEYSLSLNLISVRYLLSIYSNILGRYSFAAYLTLLDACNYDEPAIQYLTGLENSSFIFDSNQPVTSRAKSILSSLNTSASAQDFFIQLISTNNRILASTYVAERLNYSSRCIQDISSITETWLLQNSHI